MVDFRDRTGAKRNGQLEVWLAEGRLGKRNLLRSVLACIAGGGFQTEGG